MITRHNKAFKSDSQHSAFSLRSSIAERSSHLNTALAEVKKNHKIKRLFFLVRGSSFTPESQHFSMYLASGTVREVLELTEVCLREVVCLFISLVWLLWF